MQALQYRVHGQDSWLGRSVLSDKEIDISEENVNNSDQLDLDWKDRTNKEADMSEEVVKPHAFENACLLCSRTENKLEA